MIRYRGSALRTPTLHLQGNIKRLTATSGAFCAKYIGMWRSW